MHMKAAVLCEQPGELVIEELNIDSPGPQEVLIQTIGAGLCHSDLHFMEGLFRTKLPAVMGHESAGIVQAVGRDVTYVQPGDHVVACLSIFCGQCRQCLSGNPHRCSNGRATSRGREESPRLSRTDGTPVDQMARLGGLPKRCWSTNNCGQSDPRHSLRKLALLGAGSPRVWGGGKNRCCSGRGDGLCYRLRRHRPVGDSEARSRRRSHHRCRHKHRKAETARLMGATDTINASEVEDVVAAVRELTKGGVEFSFEAIGLKATAEQAFEMLEVGGTATVIGMVPSSTKLEIRGIELLSEKKLQGSMMGSNQFRTDIPQMIDLYLSGRLLLDEMVSATIDLDEVNEGYSWMKEGTVARTVITF